MKVKRHKKARKVLSFFNLSFGFKPPYKVIMDADFIAAALEGRVKLRDQIPALLQDEHAKLFVTKCIVSDLEERMKKDHFWRGPWLIAKSLKFLRCEHPNLAHPHDCIKVLLQKRTGVSSAADAAADAAGKADGDATDAAVAAAEKAVAWDARMPATAASAAEAAAAAVAAAKASDPAAVTVDTVGTTSTPSAGTPAASYQPSGPPLPCNTDRLFAGIQHTSLRRELATAPCIPIIFFHGNIPLLDTPSEASVALSMQQSLKKQGIQAARGGAGTRAPGAGLSVATMAVTQNVAKRILEKAGVVNPEISLPPGVRLPKKAGEVEIETGVGAAGEKKIKKKAFKDPSAPVNPLSQRKKKAKPLPPAMQAALEAKEKREKEERARAKAAAAAAAAATPTEAASPESAEGKVNSRKRPAAAAPADAEDSAEAAPSTKRSKPAADKDDEADKDDDDAGKKKAKTTSKGKGNGSKGGSSRKGGPGGGGRGRSLPPPTVAAYSNGIKTFATPADASRAKPSIGRGSYDVNKNTAHIAKATKGINAVGND